MKRYLTILGMAVAAMLAFAAMSAASASANQPKFELQEGGNPAGTQFKAEGPGGNLETKAGRIVQCTGTVIEGKLTGFETSEGKMTNTGCKTEAQGATCTSPGAASGTIVTEAKDRLHYTGPEQNIPAVDFLPAKEGEPFTVFTCSLGIFGSTKITVKGSLVCPITPKNTDTTEYNVHCVMVEQGVEEYQYIWQQKKESVECEKVMDFLESKGEGSGLGETFAYEHSGLEPHVNAGEEKGQIKVTFDNSVKLISTQC